MRPFQELAELVDPAVLEEALATLSTELPDPDPVPPLAPRSKLDGYANILQRLAQIGAKFEMASGK